MVACVVIDSLTADDRVQLLEVYARSVMLIELGRCTEWAALFLPDALVHCAGAGEPTSVKFKGRNELVTLGHRMIHGEFDIALGRIMPPLRCRHSLSNITLFGAGARRASGHGFLTVTTIGGREPPRWLGSGRYSDRLYKCSAGCWQFEDRTFIPDGSESSVLSANQALSG
jgi:hypothetical protein